MKNQSTGREPESRPRDRSLKEYKAWIMGIAEKLTTRKTAIELTEKEWIENWKEFWKKKPRK